jgi:hypothetical protein
MPTRVHEMCRVGDGAAMSCSSYIPPSDGVIVHGDFMTLHVEKLEGTTLHTYGRCWLVNSRGVSSTSRHSGRCDACPTAGDRRRYDAGHRPRGSRHERPSEQGRPRQQLDGVPDQSRGHTMRPRGSRASPRLAGRGPAQPAARAGDRAVAARSGRSWHWSDQRMAPVIMQ